MAILKNCRKAEIFSPSEELICEGEVFLDLSEKIWISVPLDFSREEHEYYLITFYDSISGLMRCQCSLPDSQTISNERQSVLCNIQEVMDTQQRRQDLKIPLELDIEFSCTAAPAGAVQLPDVIPAKTRNISAGGIYFICEYLLPADTQIQFQLQEASKPLLLTAGVLRTEDLPPKNGRPQYGHGCRFIDMRPRTEAALRNFIFRKQREHHF